MKPMPAYEGEEGRLYRDPWDAVADILRAAPYGHFKYMTDDPPPSESLKNAILWAADAIRANDAKLRREKRGRR